MLTSFFSAILLMRTGDIIDVLIVSLMLFVALRMLQRNVHRRVLFVFFGISALFWGARTYHWELTLHFIEGIAIAAGVGFFVVFQEDVRRFLESSLFGTFSGHVDEQDLIAWASTLLRTLDVFSQNRMGALIVIQQRTPLSNMIRGGHRLNGVVSFPLLCSIFDTHSEGHDGAVILRGAKVTRFGAHLPLSRKIQTGGRAGTRHAAALGLSELSDAIILVVSEETGEISLAHCGVLRKITLPEVEGKLYTLRRIDETPTLWRKIIEPLRRNWLLKSLCFAVSIFLWLGFVAPRDLQQRTLSVAVTLEGIPPEVLVDDPMPDEYKVTLMGSEDSFAKWPKERQMIHVPLQNLKPGMQTIALSPTNLLLPNGIFVRRFEPAIVTLNAHRSKAVTVPIVVSTLGHAPASLAYRATTTPKEVSVVIREGDPGPNMVTTEPLNLASFRRGDKVDLKLVPPAKAQFTEKTPPMVRVTLE